MKVCLNCEGTGVLRKYLNRAGEYRARHCPSCEGTGYISYRQGRKACDCSTCSPKPNFDKSQCTCTFFRACDYCIKWHARD